MNEGLFFFFFSKRDMILIALLEIGIGDASALKVGIDLVEWFKPCFRQGNSI